jgi:alpha-tubulin suppressor-like RCC1 family protein
LVPVKVQGITSGATAVASGYDHTCAVVNGGVLCWGYNNYGQLGNNSTAQSSVPVQVQGLTAGATAITAGSNHTCAVLNGSAYCWGWNSYINGIGGMLGNGTTIDSSVPVQVTGLTSGVQAIATGYSHACAVVNGRAVWCWGANDFFQLGNNSTANSLVPVLVPLL